jgi:uncharacterized protein with FMN-binding domain
VNVTVKKVIGVSAMGAFSAMELLNFQAAHAAPVTFTGKSVTYPLGGTVQVVITVDGASGIYKITNVTTPVQPTTSPNNAYAQFAIPTLTTEALAAQSATINGVSGASQISTAWISSLSSAISAAAAAGQTIGASSTTPAPTPSVTPTPAPTTTGTPAPKPTGVPTPTPTRGGKHRPVIGKHEDDHSRGEKSHSGSERQSSRESSSQEND